MTESPLFGPIVEIVRTVAKLDATIAVLPTSKLVDDLGIDSLDLVGVFLKVQDVYGVTIEDDDVTGLETVADLVDYVDQRKEAAAAA